GFQWAIRRGDLKLRWVDGASDQVAGLKRVEHCEPGDGWELYDLSTDPGETTDLSAERPDEVTRLTEAFLQWRRELTSGRAGPARSAIGWVGCGLVRRPAASGRSASRSPST